jgi:hypothetical protein
MTASATVACLLLGRRFFPARYRPARRRIRLGGRLFRGFERIPYFHGFLSGDDGGLRGIEQFPRAPLFPRSPQIRRVTQFETAA